MLDNITKTHEFIVNRWPAGLRTKSNPDYPLPYPFQPPCVDGEFKCMFYWDTFFTNRGMILDGYTNYAKYNTDNLLYLLDKYGWVPNSNSYPGVKHNSQPPYLSFMVSDVYDAIKDDEWLKNAYFLLKREHDFWMEQRLSKETGLNRYYHHEKTDQEKIDFYQYVTTRIPQLDPNASREDQIRMGDSLNCDGEAGLDFSPRFNLEGVNVVPVDLNCILYVMEANLAKWAKMFEPEAEKIYLDYQKNRLALMNKYLYNKEDGLYYDYNVVRKEFQQTSFSFTAQFWPFIAGISCDKEVCKKLLNKLEYDYGIAATQPYPYKEEYQAAYPYSFPYDNYFAYAALSKLGLVEDCIRISYKYMKNLAKQYEVSGHLWECNNAIVDGVAIKNEYPNTEMMGWSAGTFECMYKYVLENEK